MFKSCRLLATVTIVMAGSHPFCISAQTAEIPVYLDESQPIEARVADAMHRMTLEEKIAMIHAQSKFSSPGVPRLGIPELWTSDGPHGIRPEVFWDKWEQAGWSNDSCTAFPALTCLAATWNPDMALLYGKAIGEEARYRNKDVLLGPGVNICRTPLNGRNFEYMGEDPYLASVMVVPYIKGVQQNGVATCVKHFALNNQEHMRHNTDVTLSDRALYEIYLPAFKAAVLKGGAWSIMASYNLYNGQHVCQNAHLLKDILRKEWGFDGVVISDWGGVHDTPQAIIGGLDIEFGSWTNGLSEGAKNAYDDYYLATPYLNKILNGEVGSEELDARVANVLRLLFRTAMNTKKPFGSIASPEHATDARRIAGEGIVLLRNEGNILPMQFDGKKKIAVIGENAIKKMTVGGGSSSLKAKYEISPLEGIRRAVNSHAEVIYSRGYVGDTTSTYNNVHTGVNLHDDRSADELIAEAVNSAKDADYVIFVGGLNKSEHQDAEASDRLQLALPYDQDKVIRALADTNPNLIIVNISGNPVEMPWINDVHAIVQAWYIGSEAGNAIADILTGAVNPSGKLPMTFPASLDQVGAHVAGEYPGKIEDIKQKCDTIREHYSEDIFVGYRWADAHNTQPIFPFGHGLSYTTFEYGIPTIDTDCMTADTTITLTIPITNTGNRQGAETVQLYISDLKSTLPRPIKELKGFRKLDLAPGQTEWATFVIDRDALSYFDDSQHKWIAEPGKFKAMIGSSSRDIRATVPFSLR